MKLGQKDNCRHCKGEIMICRLRSGKWAPFDIGMVAATPDAVEAFLPVRSNDGAVALVPVADVAPRQMQGVRWLAQRHRCAEFYRAKAAERERVDSFGDALIEHFGLQATGGSQ